MKKLKKIKVGLRIRFMGLVLMQVELISLVKLPKEEN
jgi:hypothetical protein